MRKPSSKTSPASAKATNKRDSTARRRLTLPVFSWTVLLASAVGSVPVAWAAEGDAVSFNDDIRPILSNSCWHCHGPGKQEVGLRLDVRDFALAETDGGVLPIVPGNPEDSEAIKRIFSEDEWDRMPPPDSHLALSDGEKELIRRWVAEGARYEVHWAIAPLQRPAIPRNGTNPIDAFIDARLEANSLLRSPQADDRTLLRRVTLDLTGLPPTPREVDEFVKGRFTYEDMVDRLLSTRRHAEHQARYWLDAVRFADTRGFHSDDEYPIWPYRDYVLNAFHENMPFDRFTREQIAGDMLPDATRQQRLASAFNRLNRTSTEGGIQEKEYLAKYGADRVRTIGTVWLGQTIGCAECHDHKYDPIKQRDFYSMKAFFADMRHPSAHGGEISLPTPEQASELAGLNDLLKESTKALDHERANLEQQRNGIEELALQDLSNGSLFWAFQRPIAAKSNNGAVLEVFNDRVIESELNYDSSNYVRRWNGNGIVEAIGENPDKAVYEIDCQPGTGSWAQLGVEVFYNDSLPGNSLGRGNETYLLSSIEVLIKDVKEAKWKKIPLSAAIDDGKGARPPRLNPMCTIDDDDMTGWGSPYYRKNLGNRFLAIQFSEEVHTTPNSIMKVRLRQETEQRKATIGRFRIAFASDRRCMPIATPLPWMVGTKNADIDGGKAPPIIATGLPPALVKSLQAPPKDRTKEQVASISVWMDWSHPELTPFLAACEQAKQAYDACKARIPTCFVSSQSDTPVDTQVLQRGDWMDDSGEIVKPAIPSYLGTVASEDRLDRLDLANWLTSSENPLTARVFVNRLWARYFGRGIAPVLDDLGSQGGTPTHPELLDWLASEFRKPLIRANASHEWDIKHIVRLIVTSDTYKQSSVLSAKHTKFDPSNDLFSRQNRYRLDAEAIRDSALAVGGLLKNRFGGPSVRPYQAEGYLSSLYYPRRDYPTSNGDDLWRRSLYTFWQRTFPHPSLMAFDGCTREESQVSRFISNTPLQSLVLLNDPIFVEAARGLAKEACKVSRPDKVSQISTAFSRATSRTPSKSELTKLVALYDQAKDLYAKNGKAEQLLSIGDSPKISVADPSEFAALTIVCRAVLNLHETITRN